MNTFRQFSSGVESIPASISWYLADLGEARGKQELHTHQSSQRLKVLREHALIESAVSSNRIEGVEVDRHRIATLVFGKPLLRDRDEEEVRGYRDALTRIHTQAGKMPVAEASILQLHQTIRGDIHDAGRYKEKNGDIIEKSPDGRARVRFRTVPASQTPGQLRGLIELWQDCLKERWVHPLIALAAFNLDFLCIHPFRDGNGRVSRLLLLLQCYHLGYEVGRYVSLERLIEQNKERYYETLEQSSQRWHEAKHDPWPYVRFVLYVLKTAYQEFEERLGQIKAPRGAKTEQIVRFIGNQNAPFSVASIQQACPGVSLDLIRRTLKTLRADGRVVCLGRGQKALWERK